MYIISTMSGNSLDGIDITYVKAENKKIFKLIYFKNYEYTKEESKFLRSLFPVDNLSIEQLSKANFKLGYIFSDKIKKFINEFKINKIDIIANSGQTVYHNIDTEIPSTLQISSGPVIANNLDILTISNFRQADIAVGGHGAPLVAFVDNILFNDLDKEQILLNIGGIANITYLKKGKTDTPIAFDTGPGNILIDAFSQIYTKGMQTYDKDGNLSKRGKLNEQLLNFLKKHPFILKRPPKSTGKEDFGTNYVNKILEEFKSISLLDIIKTTTYFTAYNIYINVKEFIKKDIDEFIISGGGAKNKQIIYFLKKFFPNTKFIDFYKKFNIPSQAKESFSFAVLAYYTINGLFNNISHKRTILGEIALNPSFKGKIII